MTKFRLKAIIETSKANLDVWISLVVDTVAIGFTYIILNFTSITANLITFYALIFGIASAISVILDYIELASLFYYISLVLDLSDGKTARLRGTASPSGKIIDLITDRIVFVLLSISYLYTHLSNGQLEIAFHSVVFFIGFLLFDVFELVSVVGKYYSGDIYVIKRSTAKYKAKFRDYRMWIPKRLFLLFVFFVLIPLTHYNFILIVSCNILLLLYMIMFFRSLIITIKTNHV